ncbi:MAG: hypothetical protein HC884_02905 [Chloroflexaceae bacterium]|nr:hypothetical protein [Chloroflexaceae bacterium]
MEEILELIGNLGECGCCLMMLVIGVVLLIVCGIVILAFVFLGVGSESAEATRPIAGCW